jgi:hypothetical protein
MSKIEISQERLIPISELADRYERTMRVKNYFNDRKEAERLKMEQRETILGNINSGKYDHIFKR